MEIASRNGQDLIESVYLDNGREISSSKLATAISSIRGAIEKNGRVLSSIGLEKALGCRRKPAAGRVPASTPSRHYPREM